MKFIHKLLGYTYEVVCFARPPMFALLFLSKYFEELREFLLEIKLIRWITLPQRTTYSFAKTQKGAIRLAVKTDQKTIHFNESHSLSTPNQKFRLQPYTSQPIPRSMTVLAIFPEVGYIDCGG